MDLHIPLPAPLTGLHAGLFVSRRDAAIRHPERTIDSHELILVRSGSLEMHHEDQPLTIGTGEALLLTAGRRHGGTADYANDLSFYWLHFSCAEPAGQAMRLPCHSRPRRPALLMELLHRYLDDHVGGTATTATAGLLVHLILAELAASPVAVSLGGQTAHLVGRAESWIGHHYHEGISTSDVAAAVGCNADHLGRIFRRVTGRTLVQALHERRLGEARRRLIETTADITDIARMVGFNDVVHFRRIFRRRTGSSPGMFRRLHARIFVNSD